MMSNFKSIDELFSFGRELRDALIEQSLNTYAQELSQVLDEYFSTTSDALGSMLDALESARPGALRVLPPSAVERLDMAIHDIRVAFDRANNPNGES